MAQYAAAHPGELSHRAYVISTYALCGFSNFLSIGIQIGGIGALGKDDAERQRLRQSLARLGIKALIGGSLASFMTATIAGILVP